jgi:hypothetical protein
MTAPDHFAKTELNPFAGGDRPHMNYTSSHPYLRWGSAAGEFVMSFLGWFRSGWRSPKESVAKAAVDQIDDQTLLGRIIEDRRANPVARAEAAKKIIAHTLWYVPLPYGEFDIRMAAIRQCTDQPTLMEIAAAPTSLPKYRQAAAERITDRSIRAELQKKIAEARAAEAEYRAKQRIGYEKGMAALNRNKAEREREGLQTESEKIESQKSNRMLDAMANVFMLKQSGQASILTDGENIIKGFWIKAFPENTSRPEFIRSLCAMAKNEFPNMRGLDSAHRSASIGSYKIQDNPEKGGIDILFG